MVTVQHPAHVHFFRPVIEALRADGHAVRVCARDKDLTVPLLEAHGVEHTALAGSSESTVGRALVQARYELGVLRAARRFDPDVIVAISGVAASHVAPLVGARSVVLSDSEADGVEQRLAFPFAHFVVTPEWYDGDLGYKHVTYRGLHELAYLDPRRFEPDPAVVREAGVDPESTYSVVRFVSWGAQHDVGEGGFSPADRRRLVERLAAHGDVYVTSEDELGADLEPYRLPVEPEAIHHLLAFADLYVGDSQTMATEAALVGTPAVRSNSFAAGDDMANFRRLEEQDLVFSTGDPEAALARAEELLASDGGDDWARKRDTFLEDAVDVTDFVADLLVEVGRP
ncbi:MAG: DUF354 domain-containing protein [Haloarculaceae archaeon]